jgi:hypothetical protein
MFQGALVSNFMMGQLWSASITASTWKVPVPLMLPLQVDIVTTNFPPHAQEELKSKIITLNPNVLPQLLRLKR